MHLVGNILGLLCSSSSYHKAFSKFRFLAHLESFSVVDDLVHLATEVNITD